MNDGPIRSGLPWPRCHGKPKAPYHRRFLRVLFLGFCFSQAALGQTTAKSDPQLIPAENRRPGARDWQLTRVRPDKDGFRTPWIEGYCSRQSVQAGQTIDVMVSTNTPRRFQVEIFRMGYYGGRGARLMQTLGPFAGRTLQVPAPGVKDVHEC